MKKSNVKKYWHLTLEKIAQQYREWMDQTASIFLKRELIKIPVQKKPFDRRS